MTETIYRDWPDNADLTFTEALERYTRETENWKPCTHPIELTHRWSAVMALLPGLADHHAWRVLLVAEAQRMLRMDGGGSDG